jgi:hypothetical protein
VSTDSEEKERSVVPRGAIQLHESAKWRKETGVLSLSLSLEAQGEGGESFIYVERWFGPCRVTPQGRRSEGGAAILLRGISPGSSHDYLTGVLVYGNEMFSKKTGVRSRPKSLTGVSKYKYSCLGSRNKNGSSTFFFLSKEQKHL